MTVIYCYLERKNYKVLKFHINNFTYFEISPSLFKASKLDKCQGRFLEEMPYLKLLNQVVRDNCFCKTVPDYHQG